jgi:hypothetical protein
MMEKFGVNSIFSEKKGPIVKNAIKEDDLFEKIVLCSCGKKFVKSCPNKEVCDISILKCPHCGADIK